MSPTRPDMSPSDIFALPNTPCNLHYAVYDICNTLDDTEFQPFPSLDYWYDRTDVVQQIEAAGLTLALVVDETDHYNRHKLTVAIWYLHTKPFMITYNYGKDGRCANPPVITDTELYLDATSLIHRTIEMNRIKKGVNCRVVPADTIDPVIAKIHNWDIRSDFTVFRSGHW